MRKLNILLFSIFIFILQSCNFGLQEVTSSINSGGSIPTVQSKSKWTFIVYMAADNNLNSSALDDFREMECADCNSDNIKTLVLFDRAPSSLADDKTWTGTKLFEINHSSAKTKSIQLNINALGINPSSSAELDMGDPETLISLLSFSRKYYPAEKYALIVWGHGTGYRFNSNPKNRAIAIDETSGTFMEIPELRKAIKSGMGNEKLELIGFDTCFGSELEELYELRDETNWFVGVEGVQDATGWDYSSWMNQNLEECNAGNEVAKLIEKQYSSKNDKSFAIVNMTSIQELFETFDSFSSQAAKLIKDEKSAKKLKESILKNANVFTVSGSLLNPVYIEISSMCNVLLQEYPELDKNFLNVSSVLKQATSETYCSAQEIFPIGIYFCSLDEKGEVSDKISAYYTQGSDVKGQCQFVQKASGYVPTSDSKGSLLDKLLSNHIF